VQAKKGGMDGKKREKKQANGRLRDGPKANRSVWEALMLGEALVKLEESRISKK
jgi:hypothetical protein